MTLFQLVHELWSPGNAVPTVKDNLFMVPETDLWVKTTSKHCQADPLLDPSLSDRKKKHLYQPWIPKAPPDVGQ